MRTALISLGALAVALTLAACGDEGATEPTPKTFHPEEQAAVMPDDAPPQEEAMSEAGAAGPDEGSGDGEPASCASELGAAESARLVARCIAVSPATHPPCNAANPCDLIQGEIDRSCAQYGPNEDKPADCSG